MNLTFCCWWPTPCAKGHLLVLSRLHKNRKKLGPSTFTRLPNLPSLAAPTSLQPVPLPMVAPVHVAWGPHRGCWSLAFAVRMRCHHRSQSNTRLCELHQDACDWFIPDMDSWLHEARPSAPTADAAKECQEVPSDPTCVMVEAHCKWRLVIQWDCWGFWFLIRRCMCGIE
jgi:hypothetical protein